MQRDLGQFINYQGQLDPWLATAENFTANATAWLRNEADVRNRMVGKAVLLAVMEICAANLSCVRFLRSAQGSAQGVKFRYRFRRCQ